MILLIDNYDSFSYNLYQMIGSICEDISVIRNDAMKVSEIESLAPTHIILSPGPGRPEDAGICIELIRKLGGRIPMLGVCLGHQAIFEAYGGKVSYAKQLMHGKQSSITIKESNPLFKDLPSQMKVARYHSLAGLKETLPKELSITAETSEGEIMAIGHREYPVYGVQFHPESILTHNGQQIIKNFMEVTVND